MPPSLVNTEGSKGKKRGGSGAPSCVALLWLKRSYQLNLNPSSTVRLPPSKSNLLRKSGEFTLI